MIYSVAIHQKKHSYWWEIRLHCLYPQDTQMSHLTLWLFLPVLCSYNVFSMPMSMKIFNTLKHNGNIKHCISLLATSLHRCMLCFLVFCSEKYKSIAFLSIHWLKSFHLRMLTAVSDVCKITLLTAESGLAKEHLKPCN